MVDELRYFLTALGYFTRIPVPRWVGFAPHYLQAAARYFALVGLLVGLIGAVVTWLAWQWWSPGIAVLLGMAATLLLTGAFHEDGLADCVDAFGGGYRREDVLRIMHDSRIGAFGGIALVIALLLKWQLLVAVGERGGALHVAALLVCAHAASRAMAVSYLATLEYVRAEGKAKPVAQRLSMGGLSMAIACGALPWILLSSPLASTFASAFPSALATTLAALPLISWQTAVLAALALVLVRVMLGRYFVRRLGGYTGDCLGMAQQLGEIAVYLVAAAAWN